MFELRNSPAIRDMRGSVLGRYALFAGAARGWWLIERCPHLYWKIDRTRNRFSQNLPTLAGFAGAHPSYDWSPVAVIRSVCPEVSGEIVDSLERGMEEALQLASGSGAAKNPVVVPEHEISAVLRAGIRAKWEGGYGSLEVEWFNKDGELLDESSLEPIRSWLAEELPLPEHDVFEGYGEATMTLTKNPDQLHVEGVRHDYDGEHWQESQIDETLTGFARILSEY
jgi:hypothetical protein